MGLLKFKSFTREVEPAKVRAKKAVKRAVAKRTVVKKASPLKQASVLTPTRVVKNGVGRPRKNENMELVFQVIKRIPGLTQTGIVTTLGKGFEGNTSSVRRYVNILIKDGRVKNYHGFRYQYTVK